jgi:outer membrane protein assembly factor BamB
MSSKKSMLSPPRFAGLALQSRSGIGLMRELGWVLVLMLVMGGAPSQAQADAWHGGAVGIRWALRADDVVLATSRDGLLAVVDEPSRPELLIAADSRGAVGIDVGQVRVAWEYRRPPEDWYAESVTPPLMRDGKLYLYNTALDARSGQQVWQAHTGPIASMSLVDDVVYLAGLQDVWALNAQNGQILWQTGIAVGTGRSGSQPVLFGDTLVVHSVDGQVWGLDARSGQLRWQLPFKVMEKDRLTGSAGSLFVPKSELGQLLAFAAADGMLRWTYPATDAAGTYAAPRLAEGAVPLVDGGVLYVVDIEGRVLAIEAQRGARRWASEPVLADDAGQENLRQVGQTLIAADPTTSPLGLDRNTGQIRWRADEVTGRSLGVVFGDLLLFGDGAKGMSWIPAATGQVAGHLAPEPRPAVWQQDMAAYEAWDDPYRDLFPPGLADAAVEGRDEFVYSVRGAYVVAIGPAAPGEAVSMARAFLARGDYRSAARTLSLLKVSDEQGYLAHGGETLAAEALDTWLDELEAEAPGGSFRNLTNSYWREDITYDVAQLGIRETQARMKYADALAAVWEFGNEGAKQGGLRSAGQIPEVHQLKERYGDTLWAEQMGKLLETPRKPAAPRMALDGPAYLGWWYLPFVLPLVVLFVGVLISRQRQGIYRTAVAAGLSLWGGLVYLFWVGRLLTNPGAGYHGYLPLLSSDLALMGGVPLVVLLLTRSKTLALVTLAVSIVTRFTIFNSLLTIL